MNLKFSLALMLLSTSVLAAGTAVSKPSAGAVTVPIQNAAAAAKGNKAAKETIKKSQEVQSVTQEKASAVESKAAQEINSADAEQKAWAEKVEPKAKKILKDCTTSLCGAIQSGVMQEAKEGNPNAVKVLSSALEAARGKNPTEQSTAIAEALEKEKLNPKEIEEACAPGK